MSLLSRFALQGASGAPGQTYWYGEFRNTYDQAATLRDSPIVYVQPNTGNIALSLGSGNDKAVLAKIDTNGNVLWSLGFTNASSPYFQRIERIGSTYIDDSGNSYFFGEGNDSTQSSREAQMVVVDSSGNVTLNLMPCANGTYNQNYFSCTAYTGTNFISIDRSGVATLMNTSGIILDEHSGMTQSTPDGTLYLSQQDRDDRRIATNGTDIWMYGYTGSYSTIFRFTDTGTSLSRNNAYYIKVGSSTLRGRSMALNSDGSKQAFTHTIISNSNYYDCVSFGSVSTGITGSYINSATYGANRNNFVAFDDDNNVYWCFVGPYNNPIITNYLVKFDLDTGAILFQRELNLNQSTYGGSVQSMTVENDALHIFFGGGGSGSYSSMIKLPLNGSGLGTYGLQIPITYQEAILPSLNPLSPGVVVGGPYSFSSTNVAAQNYNLDTSGMLELIGDYYNNRLDEILETPASTADISENVRQAFITTGSNTSTERTINANPGDLIIDQTVWATHFSAGPTVQKASSMPALTDHPTELRTDDPSTGTKVWLTSYYKYSDVSSGTEAWRWSQAVTNQRNRRFTLTIPSAQYVSFTYLIRSGSATGWTPPSISNLLAGDRIAITQVHVDQSSQLFDAVQTDSNLEMYESFTVPSYALGYDWPMINAVAVAPSNGTYQLPTFSYAGDYDTDTFNIMIHAVAFRPN